MREVVNDEHAVDLSFHFHSPLHALKRRQRLGDRFKADSPSLRHGHRSQCVQNIVPARRRKIELSRRLASMCYMEAHNFALDAHTAGDPVVCHPESIRFHGTKRLFGSATQCWPRIIGVAPDDDSATSRHEIYESPKGEFISGKVRINVCMIVFDRSNNEIVGVVMKKFRPSVPKCGLVLISFEDEFLPSSQAIALPEIFRNATDKKVWLLPCRL